MRTYTCMQESEFSCSMLASVVNIARYSAHSAAFLKLSIMLYKKSIVYTHS